MSSKIVNGSSIEYSIVPINESMIADFSIIDHLRENLYENVEGVIVDSKFYSLMDNYMEPRTHWSIAITGHYETEEPWLLINKKPGDLYHPMSYISRCLTYNVTEYDIWSCDQCDGPVAVITEADS